jgi:hypothetical protein
MDSFQNIRNLLDEYFRNVQNLRVRLVQLSEIQKVWGVRTKLQALFITFALQELWLGQGNKITNVWY